MTPEQKEEVERSSTLFHIALVQLGAKSMQDALSLWEDVPPIPTAGAGRATEAWLATTVKYVMQRRLRARDLALAYYRYQRALTTGTTIAIPGHEDPPYLTLFELKREFEAYLNPSTGASESSSPTNETQAVSEAGSAAPVAADEASEDDEIARLEAEEEAERQAEDQILVETIEGLDEEMAEAERQAEEEIEQALQALGPRNMDQKMRDIEVESADELDEARQRAHREAGNRQAATTARESMNGARGSLFDLGSRDRRVLGFIRVSRTGTPCGWCAMLMSRGPIYKSAQGTSAQATYGDLDLYHDNCQCYAVPIFTRAQLESEELYALNREYAEMWPKVTKGLTGKSAISAWRRFIRQQAKSHNAQEAAA